MFLCLLIAFNWWHFSGVFMSALKLNHFVKQLVQLIQTFISPFTNIKQSFSFYALFRCMHANNFQWTVQKYGCDHKCKKYALVYFNASFITCKEMVFLGELLRVAQVKSGRQFGWSLSCIFQFCVSYTSDGQWTDCRCLFETNVWSLILTRYRRSAQLQCSKKIQYKQPGFSLHPLLCLWNMLIVVFLWGFGEARSQLATILPNRFNGLHQQSKHWTSNVWGWVLDNQQVLDNSYQYKGFP